VEDIDAISDYIVVHDRAWNIVRTNRSLATHLGVPPVALVGEAMSSLRQIAETGSDLPCPFLPGYAAIEGRVRGGVGGAHLSGVDFADARRFR